MSPARAGRFFTTEPPGKAMEFHLKASRAKLRDWHSHTIAGESQAPEEEAMVHRKLVVKFFPLFQIFSSSGSSLQSRNKPWTHYGALGKSLPPLGPGVNIPIPQMESIAQRTILSANRMTTPREPLGNWVLSLWEVWFNGHKLGQTLRDGDDRKAWCATVHWVEKSWTWLDRTTTIVGVGRKV